MRQLAIICSGLAAFLILSPAAVAQQKTAKACTDEWRANKADNQAKGIKEKDYVAQCRAAGATQPATKPALKPASAPPPPAPARTSSPQPAPAAKPAPAAAAAPAGANQFSTEAQAKARCGSGAVVWVNLSSKIYHFAGHKDYGATKSGAYMCESDTAGQGMRAAKNEKHP